MLRSLVPDYASLRVAPLRGCAIESEAPKPGRLKENTESGYSEPKAFYS
jgi:hypothetical protein